MLLLIASCTGSMQNDDRNSVLELDASVEEVSEEVNEDEDEFESSETEESENFASSEINSEEERANVESELTSSNEDAVMRRTSRNKSRDSSRNSKVEKEKVFHTVTFENGNTVLKTQKVQHGESAVAPEVPAKKGYDFDGWNKSFDNVKRNLTVKTKWINLTQTKQVDNVLFEITFNKGRYKKGDDLYVVVKATNVGDEIIYVMDTGTPSNGLNNYLVRDNYDDFYLRISTGGFRPSMYYGEFSPQETISSIGATEIGKQTFNTSNGTFTNEWPFDSNYNFYILASIAVERENQPNIPTKYIECKFPILHG